MWPQYLPLATLVYNTVVLYTKWTLATQMANCLIRKTHGAKLVHHF